jgi:hypothetical protein
MEAILKEIEAFVPDDFRSADDALNFLAAAVEVAGSDLIDRDDPRERAAVQDECRQFIRWLRSLTPEQVAAVQPPPYRRVLQREEGNRHMAEVEARWGRWNGGGAEPPPSGHLPPHLVLQASLLQEQGRLPDVAHVLAEHGVSRVFELREFAGGDYELDLATAGFQYNAGGEGWWTVAGAPWLVQASHEDSLTVGGDWLVHGLQERWLDWRDLIYRDWDRSGPPVM